MSMGYRIPMVCTELQEQALTALQRWPREQAAEARPPGVGHADPGRNTTARVPVHYAYRSHVIPASASMT